MDDKPAVRDPGETADLRSRAVRLRDQSHVVERADETPPPGETTNLRPPAPADPTLDHLEVAAEKHNRVGLIIGGIAAALVLAIVIFVATRGSSTPAPNVVADAAPPVAIVDAPRPQVLPADAAEQAIDAAVADPKPPIDAPKDPAPKVSRPRVDPPRPHPDRRHDSFEGGSARPPRPVESGSATVAAPSSLSITSDPYATIYLDGKKLGETPLFRTPITSGKHAVRAVLADGREKTFTIDAAPNKEYNAGKLTW